MLDIHYQDEHFIVVNKPSGLLCVPGLSHPDNLFDQVKAYNPNARTVHRLDMGTSGLVIFALHYDAQKKLSRLFETRKIYKSYTARIAGKPSVSKGEIHSPMLCDWPNRPKQKIDWFEGKPASTYFECISSDDHTTLVNLKPITGRTHQLRVHMLQIGHPILGDQFYNINDSHTQANRLLLHARELRFNHPFTDVAMHIVAPADFVS